MPRTYRHFLLKVNGKMVGAPPPGKEIATRKEVVRYDLKIRAERVEVS